MTIRLRVLSLGAGVQSTTLALMAAHGEIGPMPDCAIFADTGWEPAAIYRHLDWLETQVPFPVRRVKRAGLDLGQHAIYIAHNDVTRTASPPWYTKFSGPKSEGGFLPRQCSKEFKVRVITKEVRAMMGLAPGDRGPKEPAVEQWLGISTDEMQRMKDAEVKWIKHRFPLIENRISRRDCLRWMSARGYPEPAKSSCIFCPYRGDQQWRDMRDHAPDDWARAIQFDRDVRPGFFGMDGEAFLHRQRVPLNDVDLRTDEDLGQINMFDDECEGMCGV